MTLDGVSPEAMAAWQRLDEMTGGSLRITSAYRSPEHNARVGGAKHSQHTHGNAFDIDAAGMTPEQKLALAGQARDAGFRGFGFYDNALHFDVGPERAWGPDYTSASLPAYAANFLGTRRGDAQPNTLMASAPAGGDDPLARMERVNALMALRPRAFQLDARDFMV